MQILQESRDVLQNHAKTDMVKKLKELFRNVPQNSYSKFFTKTCGGNHSFPGVQLAV